MPVRHHPSAQVRADYASANLGPGAALAVTTHLEFCSVCAIAVQAMDGFPEAPRERGKPARASHVGRSAQAHENHVSEKLPHPLKTVVRHPWRRIDAHTQASCLQGVSGLGEAVWLVEVQRPTRLSFAAGPGLWAAVVLDGEIRDGDLKFTAGDFVDLTARPLTAARAERATLILLVTDDAWGRPFWRRLLDRLAPGPG